MELNDAARALIGAGADATLVTINPDGSPQVSVVWVALQSTPDGDEGWRPTYRVTTRSYETSGAIPTLP